MKTNAIELAAARMLCDTPGCGHVEEVPARDVRKYLGAQCPKCSRVMVTEETIESAEAYLAALDSLNAIIGPVEKSAEPIGKISARIDTKGELAEAKFTR